MGFEKDQSELVSEFYTIFIIELINIEYPNVSSNLNGKFSNTQVNDWHYLYWGLGKWGKGRNHIKSVQMLLRPKN